MTASRVLCVREGARPSHRQRPFERVEDGPTAGCEVRLAGLRSRWIVRLSDVDRDESLDAFAWRFAGLQASDGEAGEICLDDPDYGRVVCRPDGKVMAEREVDPSSWTHAGRAVVLPGGTPIPAAVARLSRHECPASMPVAGTTNRGRFS